MCETSPAERKAQAREADRRRRAVRALQLGERVCGYAARQLGDGASPGQAREAALEVAGELEAVAAAVRKAAWLRPEERRSVARNLARLGIPTRQIARQLGVDPRCVRYYVNGRPSP